MTTTHGAAPLIPPQPFIGLDGITHLAAGGETPALRSHTAAVERFLTDKSGGMPGRNRLFETAGRVRGKVARLFDLEAGDIGFLLNASEGLTVAAAGLGAGPGDNVVVAGADFPSVVLAATGLRQAGVEIRAAGSGLVATTDDYAAAVDAQTRAIFVSHVSHLTGARQDLAALRAVADAVGARLIVDVSHAAGAVPVDGRLCDIVVSCCYKWLLSVHGCGLFCVNHRRWPDLMPRTIGWHAIVETETGQPLFGHTLKPGIERFESGNVPFLAIHVLENGLDTLMAIDAADREAHCEALTRRLRDGLVARGLDVLTPEPAERRAGNVCIAMDAPERVEAGLREHGVLVWAGEERVRFSPYLYNDADDIDRCLDALGKVL
ncbi:MAG: aminotransferase class V-fold PLP-dependent enzyme [Bauldia litoralis]